MYVHPLTSVRSRLDRYWAQGDPGSLRLDEALAEAARLRDHARPAERRRTTAATRKPGSAIHILGLFYYTRCLTKSDGESTDELATALFMIDLVAEYHPDAVPPSLRSVIGLEADPNIQLQLASHLAERAVANSDPDALAGAMRMLAHAAAESMAYSALLIDTTAAVALALQACGDRETPAGQHPFADHAHFGPDLAENLTGFQRALDHVERRALDVGRTGDALWLNLCARRADTGDAANHRALAILRAAQHGRAAALLLQQGSSALQLESRRRTHDALTQQAVELIEVQRRIEARLRQELNQIEQLTALAKQAIVRSDRAREKGDGEAAGRYDEAAAAHATSLVVAEQNAESLHLLDEEAIKAAGTARKAVGADAEALGRLAEEGAAGVEHAIEREYFRNALASSVLCVGAIADELGTADQ